MDRIFASVNKVDLKALGQALTEQGEEENRLSRLDPDSKFKQFQTELESLTRVLTKWSEEVAGQKEESKLNLIRKEEGILPSSSNVSQEAQAQAINRISKEYLSNTVLARVRALSGILY